MALISKSKIKYLLYKMLPLDTYLKVIYKKYHGSYLNLKNPRRYTEKLFWLKIYNGKKENLDLTQKIYDKYRVRDYIKEKGFEEYLPKIYGVYKNANDIDFEKLPEKYAIKISQSNGKNFINNGFSVDKNTIINRINSWLDETKNLQWIEETFKEEKYYFDGESKIICEEYLCRADGKPCEEYRVFCFNGNAKLIGCDIDTVNEDGSKKKLYKRNMYDTDWNFIPVNSGREYDENYYCQKPKYLDDIINIASKLSEDFKFARVDFFDRGDRIFIGEITLIPQGASVKFTPEKYDDLFGSWINLPTNEEINEKN